MISVFSDMFAQRKVSNSETNEKDMVLRWVTRVSFSGVLSDVMIKFTNAGAQKEKHVLNDLISKVLRQPVFFVRIVNMANNK